jgi:hypothetical protein
MGVPPVGEVYHLCPVTVEEIEYAPKVTVVPGQVEVVVIAAGGLQLTPITLTFNELVTEDPPQPVATNFTVAIPEKPAFQVTTPDEIVPAVLGDRYHDKPAFDAEAEYVDVPAP